MHVPEHTLCRRCYVFIRATKKTNPLSLKSSQSKESMSLKRSFWSQVSPSVNVGAGLTFLNSLSGILQCSFKGFYSQLLHGTCLLFFRWNMEHRTHVAGHAEVGSIGPGSGLWVGLLQQEWKSSTLPDLSTTIHPTILESFCGPSCSPHIFLSWENISSHWQPITFRFALLLLFVLQFHWPFLRITLSRKVISTCVGEWRRKAKYMVRKQ